MLKKAILILIAVASTLSAAAQSVGEWTIYPVFDGTATTLVDGNSKVYYVSAGRLTSFDKQTEEVFQYSTQNKLSDINITAAYYNYDKDFLLLTYDTGNMDVVFDSGRVINLPEIKDASLNTEKIINDVAFYKGKIYIATAFGLVVYDENTFQVDESGIYGKNLQFVTVNHDKIIVYPKDSYAVYYSPVESRHNSWDKFTIWFNYYPLDLGSVGDNLYLINGNNKTLTFFKINWDTMGRTTASREDVICAYDPVIQSDGNLRAITSDKIMVLDQTGSTVSETTAPADFAGKKIDYIDNLGSIWMVDIEGLGNYDLTTTPPTVLRDKARPMSSNVQQVAFFRLSKDGKRIYFANLGDTKYKTIGYSQYGGHWVPQVTNYIENGEIHDISLYDASALPGGQAEKNQTSDKRLYGGAGRFVIDPNNPDRYYVAINTEGVYVIENGIEVGKFDGSNSTIPIGRGYTPTCNDVNIDPAGNLWVGYAWPSNSSHSPWIVLPKDKLYGDLSTVSKSDWIQSKHTTLGNTTASAFEIYSFKDNLSLFCQKSNMLFTACGKYEAVPVAYDTKGTYADTSDDVVYPMSTLTDQDGKTYTPFVTMCMAEDHRGRVWVGCEPGIYEITDPTKATDPTMRIRRLKVPRNDGTNYADYLLENDRINDIAVDSSNRKWLVTEESGIYLVSEDGDKILEHFTTDNSPLPSNSVYSVICDPYSNKVYFGLKTGLVSYSSTSSPAASDYSEIYAYPNPVRPEYTGLITVTGLMDNSLVKIADSAGNVFAQGRSNGGLFVWDGCDQSGNRVKSGVYFVFASQNADGDSSGAVTKILVIN